MSRVAIEHRITDYPNSIHKFAPSIKYPEYRWDDISIEENHVYDMVRTMLYRYGFDVNNYGKESWNPLGAIIKKGDTVVIKPNWVEDKNENKSGGMECLVTNPSIVRAIIDYVYIALDGTGKIFVGDSPMPDCNLQNLLKKMSYTSVWESCAERGIKIDVCDFREDVVVGFANEVVDSNGDQDVIVDLGMDSCFADTEFNIGKYRNGIVDATKMNTFYHTNGHHRYGINKYVLSADVIINCPKPKTHRKAGYTASLKNYIGICSRKTSIPHNVMGSQKEGGDTYYGPKFIFETEQRMRDVQNHLQTNGHNLQAIAIKICRIPFWGFRRLTHKKYFGTGNWYMNDTIWRSVIDINRIMIYADKDGKICETPQRRFFSIGDMIVAGHKNGPLAPTPIKTNLLLCSEDPVAFDIAVVNIMGLDINKLPVLNRIPNLARYKIRSDDHSNIEILSNEENLNGKNADNMPVAPYGYFEPAEGWKIVSREQASKENQEQ